MYKLYITFKILFPGSGFEVYFVSCHIVCLNGEKLFIFIHSSNNPGSGIHMTLRSSAKVKQTHSILQHTHVHTCIHIYIYIYLHMHTDILALTYIYIWPSWLGLKNTPTASLQRSKTHTPNECPGYDTKQSDGEVPAMLELWGMRRTPSLPSLPGPLWPGVVAPDRALSMG